MTQVGTCARGLKAARAMRERKRKVVSVILDSVAARFSIFDPSMKFIDGLASDREGGARTSNFSKPVALRNLSIAFGLRFTTLSGVRSTPDTTGPGGR